MTSTSSANAIGLPSNDNRHFLPFDAELVETLSADKWDAIGRTCRIAFAGNRLSAEDWAHAVGEMIDEDTGAVDFLLSNRDEHRRALLQVLAMLRVADRRDSVALDKALSSRGH